MPNHFPWILNKGSTVWLREVDLLTPVSHPPSCEHAHAATLPPKHIYKDRKINKNH
jgi:hypothetical protein